jgi:serine/threonine protein kinase
MKPGQSIDRFEIVRLLGEGGMGAVYEARDPDLARAVALKLIHEPDANRSMRFLREAQALAQLQHPNVVAVYEVGTDGERVFIAMELVDGESLEKRSGARPWREVVPLFVQVGRGLAAAHAKDLVHRDVKPSNIFVGRDGRARIGDFGLARQRDPRDGADTETPPPPDRVERASATTVDGGGDHGAAISSRSASRSTRRCSASTRSRRARMASPRRSSPASAGRHSRARRGGWSPRSIVGWRATRTRDTRR